MIIHNGDHAEFEIEHANMPPEERPDWPLPSFDARDWGKAFCKIAAEKGLQIDEAWMETWFANALMRGYDEARERAANAEGDLRMVRSTARALRAVIAYCGLHRRVPKKGLPR